MVRIVKTEFYKLKRYHILWAGVALMLLSVLLTLFTSMANAIWRNAPMTAHNGNTEQDERGLLPYPVIIAATKGDPEAMKIVVQHYESYIASLSMRKLIDERGNTYYGIDEDIRDRLRSKLMRAVLSFKV